MKADPQPPPSIIPTAAWGKALPRRFDLDAMVLLALASHGIPTKVTAIKAKSIHAIEDRDDDWLLLSQETTDSGHNPRHLFEL